MFSVFSGREEQVTERNGEEMELGRGVAAHQYLHFGMEGQFYLWSYGSRRWSVPEFFVSCFTLLVFLPTPWFCSYISFQPFLFFFLNVMHCIHWEATWMFLTLHTFSYTSVFTSQSLI